MATILDECCRDHKAVQAAKVRWLEDGNAVLRERELIYESTTEGEDKPAEIPVARSQTPPVIHPSHEPVIDDGPIEPDIPQAAGETKYVTMEPDSYGLFRSYPNHFPTYNPDNLTSISHISDLTHFILTADQTGARPWWSGFGSSATSVKDNFFVPFLNSTIFHLMCWFYSGSNMKSLAELDYLMNEEVDHLDNYQGDPTDICSSFLRTDGWIEMTVTIQLPADGVQHTLETSAPEFEVPGLFYHRLLEVIKSAFCEASAEHFHLTLFKMFFQPSPNKPMKHVYSEIYSLQAMLEAHEAIKSHPPDPSCKLETVVAAVMLWSDSTHLASFGSASLWPIYLFLRNQSKYIHGKPSSFAAHHLAYIPQLSDTIQDFYRHVFGKPATAEMLTSCHQELMQAIRLLIMDNDFMHTYEFGIVIEYLNGIS
ncbi:uncharacterized protein EDB93DRAFT_1252205 [Suillus bovinus]|uniref:uncharacterized protein n=1 Tax=Suillus bovinus TaxID=48563 RepID=UPI001B862E64|nr:uncharacterized protein EDB93DRAFT_1252205 [Suillus bovinus]KAG2142742.1 hypothetical protein EDB93DRAFT_1252205 [Suillus bovinus]